MIAKQKSYGNESAPLYPTSLGENIYILIYIFRKFSTRKSWHREMAGIYGKEVTGLQLKAEALSSELSVLSSYFSLLSSQLSALSSEHKLPSKYKAEVRLVVTKGRAYLSAPLAFLTASIS